MQVGQKMASAFARVSIGSPTGPDGLPGDPAAEAERLALMAMRYAEARAAQSTELQALHGTPSQVRHYTIDLSFVLQHNQVKR